MITDTWKALYTATQANILRLLLRETGLKKTKIPNARTKSFALLIKVTMALFSVRRDDVQNDKLRTKDGTYESNSKLLKLECSRPYET